MLVLLLDAFTFPVVLITAFANHRGGLSYILTIFLFFMLAPVATSIILDMHMRRCAPVLLQFVNTFWRLVHSSKRKQNTNHIQL